jgi:uncharacterized protein
MASSTAAPHYVITLQGYESEEKQNEIKTDVQSFVVERDMFQPDMASIVISNEGGKYSALALAATVEISIGDDAGESVFKGEVIGLEPIYRGADKQRIVIRCMNKLHRLLRLRKSLTFTDKTDEEILKAVVGDAGLTLAWKHEKSIPYKHVYQHNQTDLEFLRTRAARMGCHVWCVGDTVHVKQPDLQQGPAVKLSTSKPVGDAGESTIKAFTPRLSSANILKKVTVKGWNPETKELIAGDYSAQDSKLGPDNAVKASGELGKEETFTVDHPIWSQEEAAALAKARLVDLSLSYITGECELTLDPKRTLGEVISITVNEEPDTKDTDPFNGRYYVMGVTHRVVMNKGKDGGYATILRVARDAQKQVAEDVRGQQQQAGAA